MRTLFDYWDDTKTEPNTTKSEQVIPEQYFFETNPIVAVIQRSRCSGASHASALVCKVQRRLAFM
jgi:hypothetical protein